MATAAMKRVITIAQIVRLKQVVQRWKNKSLTRRRDEPAGSSRRTPSGSLAVYVGPESTRFVIPTRFLKLPVFVALLRQAEEEFGFQTAGGLALPCEPEFFSEILRFLEEDEQKYGRMGPDEFLNLISEAGVNATHHDLSSSSNCKDSSFASSSSHHAFTPLLHKTRV